MRKLLIILFVAFMGIIGISMPLFGSHNTMSARGQVFLSLENKNIASKSLAGDVKDDRPDDNDSVGGDTSTATTSISTAARSWASTNGFDLSAFENYKVPKAHTPSSADITAFKQWMAGGSNPRNQVMNEIKQLAGESIANELWNYCNTIWKKWMNTANVGSVVSEKSGLKNVGAMQEGMFAGFFGSLITNGNAKSGDTADNNAKDGNMQNGGNQGTDDYANAKTLVTDGFVVSSDGTTYRLHNMSNGSIAYSIKAPKQAVVSLTDVLPQILTFTDYLPMTAKQPTNQDIEWLKEYAKNSTQKINEPQNVDKNVYETAATYVNQTFGEYYGQCPGPTVVKGIEALGITLDATTEDVIGSSVGEKEFVASYFGVESAAASLWKDGFLPSFDGATYRLHSGKDGKVVYSITSDDINKQKNSSVSKIVLFAGIGIVIIALISATIFVKKRKLKKV